jgi:hypothetical protein
VPPPLRAQQQPFPPDPPFAAAGPGAGGGSAPAGWGPAIIVECKRRRRIDASAALAALEGAFKSPGSLVPQYVEGSTKENVGLMQPEKLTVFSRQLALQHWFETKKFGLQKRSRNSACTYDIDVGLQLWNCSQGNQHMQHWFDGGEIVLYLWYSPRTKSKNFGLHIWHHITIWACIVLKESACQIASHHFTAMETLLLLSSDGRTKKIIVPIQRWLKEVSTCDIVLKVQSQFWKNADLQIQCRRIHCFFFHFLAFVFLAHVAFVTSAIA